MSATNVDLGNVEYLYLRNIDCNGVSATAAGASSFSWNLPYINPKEAPYMFIQVVQAYADYGTGAVTPAVGTAAPQRLMYSNINGLNSYATGGGQLASIMERDTLAGHWMTKYDAPMIQVPSNLTQIRFTLNINADGSLATISNDGSLDILLKIVRPKREAVTANTLASYVRTLP
jgi:hypothetical protein